MRRWTSSARIAAGVVVVLILAHTAGWWWLSRRVQAGFADWTEAQRAAGRHVSAGAMSLSGWPFAAGVSVADLAVDGPGWRWAAARMDVTLRPTALQRLRLVPRGTQTLTVGALNAALEAKSLLVTVDLATGGDPALDASGIILATSAGPVRADTVRADTVDAIAGQSPGTTLTVYAAGVTLPPGPAYLLGPAIALIDAQATADRPLPPPRADELATWRATGGTVRLDALRLQWGVLTADATGTASLDPALQPVGDFRVALTGQDAALDAATAQGLLQPRAALAVRAVLALLARATPGSAGAEPPALPVSVRDGTVSLAGFPIARVPGVSWPTR